MDRMLNPRIEKQTIYEIYRACRLCGAGAGYKMPIMQNVVDLESSEVDLKQKIRDCLQIEVHQDDKMPPLICELCVDKVNDFYEFLDLCRKTNKRTRLRLGLPLQAMSKGSSDGGGDCILGVTEPVYVNDASDAEDQSVSRQRTKAQKKVYKKEANVKMDQLSNTRSKSSKRSPTPPRVTRVSSRAVNEPIITRNKSHTSTPKSILKKEVRIKIEDKNTLLSSRLKRGSERSSRNQVPVKRVKIAIKSPSPPPPPKRSLKVHPKPTTRPTAKPTADPYKCIICKTVAKNAKGLSSHMRTHTVTFTNDDLACNACGVWFSTSEQAATHHRRHRTNLPYHCRRCSTKFKQRTDYDDHITNNACVQEYTVPDVKCPACWRMYPTETALRAHRCPGAEGRVGGKCSKCNKNFVLMKNLTRHEGVCTYKKKEREVKIPPSVRKCLKPLQIRMARCDPLLKNMKGEHYDVSGVCEIFGLDPNCIYPHSSLPIKAEPFEGMVSIKDDVKLEFLSEDYVHWDSSSESEEELAPSKSIDTLARLSLRTLFSKQCLGKVRRKKRRVKTEGFDVTTSEFDMSKNIDKIIGNLSDDEEFGNKDVVRVNNNMFDDLFNNDLNQGNDKANDLDANKESDLSKDVTDNVNDSNSISQVNESPENNDKPDVKDVVDVDATEKSNNNDSDAKDISKDNGKSNDCELNNTVDSGNDCAEHNKINDVEENEVSYDTRVEPDNISGHEKIYDSQTADKVNDDVKITGVDPEMDKESTEKTIDGPEMTEDIPEKTDDASAKNNDISDAEAIDIINNDIKAPSVVNESNKDSIKLIDTKENTTNNDKLDHDSSKDILSNDIHSNDVEIESKNKEEASVDDNISNTVKDSINDSEDISSCNNKIDTKTNDENINTKILNEISEQKDVRKENDTKIKDSNSIDSENTKSIDIHTNDKHTNDSNDIQTDSPMTVQNGSQADDMSFGDVTDTEMDDKKLMDALDAQIGESPENVKDKDANDDIQANDNDSKDDKITLDDLISKRDAQLHSMDLDNVSDAEFDLD